MRALTLACTDSGCHVIQSLVRFFDQMKTLIVDSFGMWTILVILFTIIFITPSSVVYKESLIHYIWSKWMLYPHFLMAEEHCGLPTLMQAHDRAKTSVWLLAFFNWHKEWMVLKHYYFLGRKYWEWAQDFEYSRLCFTSKLFPCLWNINILCT